MKKGQHDNMTKGQMDKRTQGQKDKGTNNLQNVFEVLCCILGTCTFLFQYDQIFSSFREYGDPAGGHPDFLPPSY